MSDFWAANVVVQLRIINIKQKDFAKLYGYSEQYMSEILRGKKDTKQARQKIESEIAKLKKEKGIYI